MTRRPVSRRSATPVSRRYSRPLTTALLALPLAVLPACSTTTTVNRPASACSTLVPKSLRAKTPGWAVPTVDTVPAWAAAFVGQTGQLAVSDTKGAAALEIVEACEARDAEVVKQLTRKPLLRRLFG